jgi:hypothetical protein
MGGYEEPSPFVTTWNALEAMLEDGEPFANIEAMIEGTQFDEDKRAALWLASWAHASQSGREAREPPTRPPRRLAAVD